MTEKKRRPRRVREATAQPTATVVKPVAGPPRATKPLPEWKWRTFPVFCAFAVAFFLGVYGGIPAGIASENGYALPTTVLTLAAALLLGLALSRITTRWIVAHNWVRRKKK